MIVVKRTKEIIEYIELTKNSFILIRINRNKN
jgi:hypothetical protein